jgi:hypothetical protein
MTGYVARMREPINAYNTLIGKPGGKRRTCNDNINTNPKEMGCETVQLIHIK